jgi:hypothetical protein
VKGNPVSYDDPFGLCPPIEDCLRQAGDLLAGFTPGVATVHDAVTVATGKNYITGEQVGFGGRALAFVGLVTPLTGGELRGGGKLLKRFGTDVESLEQLAGDAAHAARNGFPHGVSFTSHVTSSRAGSIVSVEALETAGFKVEQTGARKSHYTVHLPEPLTQEAVDLFNRVLGRTP